MGFYIANRIPRGEETVRIPEPEPEPEGLAWGEGGKEAFTEGLIRQSWMLGISPTMTSPIMFKDDPEYDFTEDPANEGYDPHIISKARSATEATYIRGQIDREMNSLEKIQSSSWGTVGEVTGAIVSPEMLVPGATGPRALTKTAALFGGIEAGREVALHQQQVTRTVGESAMNTAMVAGGVLVLGKAAQMLSRGDVEKAVTDVTPPKTPEPMDERALKAVDYETGTAGAMQVKADPEAHRMTGGWLSEALSIGPLARVLNSSSGVAKETAQILVDSPFITKGMQQGETMGASIEALSNTAQGRVATVIDNVQKQYKKQSGLSDEAFEKAVADALSYGGRHTNRFVQDAAQEYKKVLDGLHKEMVDLGMLKVPKDGIKKVVGADGYFPRMYNRDAILKGWAGLQRTLMHMARVQANTAKKSISEAQAQQIANDIMDNMMGGLPLGNQRAARGLGALQERVVDVSDTLLAPYLERNASAVMLRHVQSVTPYIEMKRAFEGTDILEVGKRIREDYQSLINKAPNERARAKLRKEETSVLADIERMKDRVLHNMHRSSLSTRTQSALRGVQAFNAAVQMGGVVLSSIPDLARPLAQYGLVSYMRGFGRYIKGIMTGAGKLNKQQANRMGIALERQLNQKSMEIMDDTMGAPNKFADLLGKLWPSISGFRMYTDVMEGITAQIANDWVLTQAGKLAKGQKLTKTQTEQLARMGLDKPDLIKAWKEAERVGGTESALKFSNTMEWKDSEFAMRYEAAVGSDVRRVIIRPGAGDKPLSMDEPIMRLLFQYMGFLTAATNRMLVAGIQQRDIALAGSVLMGISMGALVASLKEIARGGDPSDWDTARLFREGWDRAGFSGIYNPGLNLAMQPFNEETSKYSQQTAKSMLGGPTLSQMGNAMNLYKAGVEGDTEKAGRTALKMTPLLNSMHFRDIMLRMGEN